MLARLTQTLVLLLVLISTIPFASFHADSPAFASMGLLAVFLAFAGLMSTQFIIMVWVNRRRAVFPVTVYQVVRAWLTEMRVAVRVFLWWQPFRSNAIPDNFSSVQGNSPTRGVVFIHGFLCNRGLWTLWLRESRRRGIPFAAINLEPVFGSIDAYTSIIDRAVRHVQTLTGTPPVLVCHSMGGLAARAWLRSDAQLALVHHVVTIGTPHAGTALGHMKLGPFFPVNGDQMRVGSIWLAELARAMSPTIARHFRCYFSNCDNIVMPTLTATLAGADNRFVPGTAHLALAMHPTVMQETLDLLRSEPSAGLDSRL